MLLRRALHPALFSAALVPALIAGLAAGAPAAAATRPVAHAEPAGETPEPTPAELASRQARATGQAVEVVAERAEDELLWANPDGSFTSETTAGPQRVRQADGSWTDIDTTLERRPDGSVGPRAAAVDLTFSGGGTDDDLIRLAEDGKALTYGWPGKLPTPVLDGDTATYVEALPGVDLKMSASSVGYSYVMVVKSAEAAEDLAKTDLALPVRGEGVEVRRSESGGLAAVDATGEVVFEGAQPTMWDSAGGAAPRTGSAARSAAAEPVTTAQSGPEPADESAAPTVGDRVADVDVQLADGKVVLVPDATLLTAADTVYPVFIDPDETVKRTDWMYVSSAHASTEYYKFDDDEGVGRCSNWGGYLCSSSAYTNRMYFKFTPDKATWADRVVSKAVFRVYETWSFSCTASWVNLNLVDAGKVNSGTNWNNKPEDGDLMVDRKVAYGRGKSCDPDAPASWVEFSDNKDETNENLTPTVRTKLGAGQPIALSLNAKDEGDGNSWKRFRGDNAALSVTFNTKPGKPYNEGTTSPTTGCVTGAGRPFVRDNTPLLHVTAADDEKSQNLKVTFDVQDIATGKSVWSLTVDPQAQQGDFPAPVPAGKLLHGHSYRWHAKSNDGQVDSISWSDWCELSIDLEEPSVPPVVTSQDFPAEGRGKPVGQSGVFTFAAGANKDSVYGNDIDYYKWSLTTDVPTNTVNNATLGGSADSPPITPTSFGPNVLYVQSYDRAGNPSDIFRYVFRPVRACDDAAADTCAAGVWQLDETAGATAADTSGKNHPLTISGTTRVAGQLGAGDPADRALRLNGTADFASTAAVVDSRQGVTVAAWVRPSDFTHNGTVVSQAGTYGNGFSLGYSSTAKRWVFGRHKADKANPAAGDLVQATAGSIEAPVLNEWTYLTGVFDPADTMLRIYVDGKEQGAVKYTGTVWNGASSLQVGRARLNDKWVDPFAGDVDDLRIFAGVLDPADIDGLWYASRPPAA